MQPNTKEFLASVTTANNEPEDVTDSGLGGTYTPDSTSSLVYTAGFMASNGAKTARIEQGQAALMDDGNAEDAMFHN